MTHDASNQHDTSGRQDRARDDLNKRTEGSEPSVGFTGRFTPGPWEVRSGSLYGSNGAQVVFGRGHFCLRLSSPTPEEVANSILAQAAPDLLEALQAARKHLSGCKCQASSGCAAARDRVIVDAAISKALGPSVKGEGGLSGAESARRGPTAPPKTGSAEVGEGA